MVFAMRLTNHCQNHRYLHSLVHVATFRFSHAMCPKKNLDYPQISTVLFAAATPCIPLSSLHILRGHGSNFTIDFDLDITPGRFLWSASGKLLSAFNDPNSCGRFKTTTNTRAFTLQSMGTYGYLDWNGLVMTLAYVHQSCAK